MTQVNHKYPKSRPLAVAHSPTAIPAENQAPKIALRLSPRRCSKARHHLLHHAAADRIIAVVEEQICRA